ncbi:MAG TPA: helix-turn-helix transcriptional regulator [Thermoanaerobaculia bacterium]
MVDQELARNLERYERSFKEAETHIDYWLATPVIEFTEDLDRLMKEKKVSRAELARRIGSSRAYITKLLGGGANFTLHTMVKLAMALDGAVHIHIADKRAITRWKDKPPRKERLAAKKKARKARQEPAAEGGE